jgi:hypothetical protein
MTEVELLQQISNQLATQQAMEHDFIHNLRIWGFISLGIGFGMVGSFVLLREVFKSWKR